MDIGEPVTGHVKAIVLNNIQTPIANSIMRDSAVNILFYISIRVDLQSSVSESICDRIHNSIWVQVIECCSGNTG